MRIDLARIDLVGVDLMRIDLVGVDLMRIDLVAPNRTSDTYTKSLQSSQGSV